jgi:hypothetical protein
MKLLLRYSLAVLILMAVTQGARSQAILINFTNRVVSANGLSWTFDVEAKGDAQYGGADNGQWIAYNIRLDLALPAGVTLTGGTASGSATYASASSGVQVGVFVPGGGPANTQKLGLTLERADNNLDIPNDVFVKIANYTVNFSAPVLEPFAFTPRSNADVFGSSWSNFANENLFRPFTFVQVALPVKLVSFNATKEGNTAQLAWKTSEETNSDHFDVERSANGKTWETISQVSAKGESSVLTSYTALDAYPLNGANLYRLHMVDLDGTSAYSKIQSLDFELANEIVMYPNPVSDELSVKVDDFSRVSDIQIYDTNGLEVYNSVGAPSATINVKNLAAGMYVVKVAQKNNVVSSYKILVTR